MDWEVIINNQWTARSNARLGTVYSWVKIDPSGYDVDGKHILIWFDIYSKINSNYKYSVHVLAISCVYTIRWLKSHSKSALIRKPCNLISICGSLIRCIYAAINLMWNLRAYNTNLMVFLSPDVTAVHVPKTWSFVAPHCLGDTAGISINT